MSDSFNDGVRAAAEALTEQIAYYKGMAGSGGAGCGISERQASAVECAQRSIRALLRPEADDGPAPSWASPLTAESLAASMARVTKAHEDAAQLPAKP